MGSYTGSNLSDKSIVSIDGERRLEGSGLTVREAAARLKIGKTALYKALEQTGATAKT